MKIRGVFTYGIYIFLLIQLLYLIYIISSSACVLQTRHYIAFIMMAILSFFIFYKFRIGEIILGIVLVMGLFGIFVLTPSVKITFLSFNLGSFKIPFFYGQPLFLLLLIAYLIISPKIFQGILSSEYWRHLFKKH